MPRLLSLLRDESGATAVEYTIMTAMVALVAIASVTLLGAELSNSFNRVAKNLTIVVR